MLPGAATSQTAEGLGCSREPNRDQTVRHGQDLDLRVEVDLDGLFFAFRRHITCCEYTPSVFSEV
jgi:hypothetical protein